MVAMSNDEVTVVRLVMCLMLQRGYVVVIVYVKISDTANRRATDNVQ